jgi:5,10-methylenetetrahydromethanopterin reductase
MTISFHIGMLPNRTMQENINLGLKTEELGYDGVWIADSHSIMRDAYALLAVLATQTRNIKLATGVTITGTRHPAVLANSWASLQELSGGRTILGIGVGESAVHNLGMKAERLAVFEEKVKVIKALMCGETINYEGTDIQMTWGSPEHNVPVIMACSGPKSLQLGGRIADGVLFQVGTNPRFVDYALENIRQGAEASGRRLEDLTLYMRVATAVLDDHKKARNEVKSYASIAAGTIYKTVPREYFDDELWEELTYFKSNYDYTKHGSNDSTHKDLLTDRIIDAVAVAGTPAEAIERFQVLSDKGLNGFVCPAAMPDPFPYIETFAKEVMPKFQL